jgi:hypothetical protein
VKVLPSLLQVMLTCQYGVLCSAHYTSVMHFCGVTYSVCIQFLPYFHFVCISASLIDFSLSNCCENLSVLNGLFMDTVSTNDMDPPVI